jgi:ketosteroid isomerase-like protein
MEYSKHVQLVLDILKDEATGDVHSALEKMSDDYTMTWMYEARDGSLFPKSEKNPEPEMEEIYEIKGREYDIRNIAEGENVVMIEMIESYPDPETGQMYRTPQVIVLELKDDKIRTGRHYNDPRLSFKELSKEQLNSALRDTNTKLAISE